jgi:DNA-directed RNA polymerase subunit RPC12/RpoP
MFMNVTCPGCGKRCRVPESAFGQQVKCPMCSTLFQCGSVPPPSETRPLPTENPPPVQVSPQVRDAESQADPTIRYSCPRCRKSLESPAHAAGQKINCPDCGRRLQIPQTPTPTASVPVRIIASTPPPAPPPVKEELIPTVIKAPPPEPPPVRREHCLECGANITDRPRVHTCPDCGSLFCSAMCYREHHHHAHSSRRR